MIRVDTSAWVELFGAGAPIACAVDTAVASAEAALCGPIVTELTPASAPALIVDSLSTMSVPDDYLDIVHLGPTGRAEEAARKLTP